MRGKSKCRILREIRERIAEENDIPYVTRECGYRGECSGTCPRCEQELRYLEQQLAQRRRLGKSIAVTALCAGLALTAAGCVDAPGPHTTTGAISLPTQDDGKRMPLTVETLEGEVAWEPEPAEPWEDDLTGMVAYEEESLDAMLGE